MKGPPLGPGGEDITWPDQVAPRGRKASSTRNHKPQTSKLCRTPPDWRPKNSLFCALPVCRFGDPKAVFFCALPV